MKKLMLVLPAERSALPPIQLAGQHVCELEPSACCCAADPSAGCTEMTRTSPPGAAAASCQQQQQRLSATRVLVPRTALERLVKASLFDVLRRVELHSRIEWHAPRRHDHRPADQLMRQATSASPVHVPYVTSSANTYLQGATEQLDHLYSARKFAELAHLKRRWLMRGPNDRCWQATNHAIFQTAALYYYQTLNCGQSGRLAVSLLSGIFPRAWLLSQDSSYRPSICSYFPRHGGIPPVHVPTTINLVS